MNAITRLGAALALTCLASAAQAETKWVMASGYPEDSFFTKTIRQFIADVEAGTNGEVKIDLRPNGELIKLDAIRRAVQSGQIQLGEIRFGVYGNESPMYILDSVPNLANDYQAEKRLTDVQKPWFDKEFGASGMTILSYLPWPGQGFYTKFPVTDGSEFKDVKLRIYSPATQRMGELLGFETTILPFAEIPQAFSTGLIEAMFTSAQTGVDIQAWDYASHFTYTGTMFNKNAIIVNNRALSRLPEEMQQVVIAAGEKATETAWALSEQAGEAQVKALSKRGITVTPASPELQEKLSKIGEQMAEEWRAEASSDEVEVLDAYLASGN